MEELDNNTCDITRQQGCVLVLTAILISAALTAVGLYSVIRWLLAHFAH